MKPICRLVGSSLAILLSGMPLRAQTPQILESKVERLAGPPLWVSAGAVADERRIINLDLLDSPALTEYVERQRKDIEVLTPRGKSASAEKPSPTSIPFSDCRLSQYSSGQGHRGGTGSTSTLSDLAANSQSILRGIIRTVDIGFDSGVPASLLGVEVSTAVKGTAPEHRLYVLYPVAHFKIGPLHFCNTKKGFEPRPGDQILLFDYTGAVDRDDLLYAPRLDQIVFQSAAGVLFLPAQLRRAPGMDTIRSLDDVVSQMTSNAPSSSRGRAR